MQSDFNLSNRDVLSVAVEIASDKHLRKLNQNEPLSDIIHSVCTDYSVSKSSVMYALQLTDEGDASGNKYLTEENRHEIKNGSILRLVLSPSELVRQIIARLGPEVSAADGVEGKEWALRKLSTLSADPVFAKAFHASDGYNMMIEIIFCSSELNDVTCCLKSFIWLMCHHLVRPTSSELVRRLMNFVNSQQQLPVELVECCLVILKEAVKQKECAKMTVIGIPDLIQHLWNRENTTIQEKALALINALAQGPHSLNILGSMVSKQIRDTIQKDILCNNVTPSMAHELYVYQTLILGLLEARLNRAVDVSGADSKYITELNQILASANDEMQNMKDSTASLTEDGHSVALVDKDVPGDMVNKAFANEDFVCSTPQVMKAVKNVRYTRSKSNPISSSDPEVFPKRHSAMIDFSFESSVRICRLTLDCILHFARRYRKTFVRVFLEEKALSRPFLWTCERLVQLICEQLGVGKPPKHDGKVYQPMVFTAEDGCFFIAELFCHVAFLLGRTRRQMRARTPSDQEKVMNVLWRQLKEALALQPATLDQLNEYFRKFPYSEIAKIWQSEREEKEKWKLTHLPPILELKKERSEEVLLLIQQHRINTLLRGAKFPKYTARGQRVKQKSWFVCLSTNQKSFHYGDCDDNNKLMLDCSSKIAVCSIKTLVTGKKCPHVRDGRNRKSDNDVADLAFSIMLDEEPERLDFVAPDQQAFDYWTDGINCLLGAPMTSATKESEFKMLLNLEVQLQLLDTEGITLPSKPPPVPGDPPNYNFHFK